MITILFRFFIYGFFNIKVSEAHFIFFTLHEAPTLFRPKSYFFKKTHTKKPVFRN